MIQIHYFVGSSMLINEFQVFFFPDHGLKSDDIY